ncbi:MAG: SDR family oxidoreductase [Acidimicrobiales bacterium]|nr:SDR family oxidoreductase [Acidimicrobiales bacterium]
MAGRTCLITGGSKGLGRHMADVFLEAGAFRVYITARNTEVVEATAEELTRAHEGDCIPIAGDLSTMEDVENLAAEIAQRESHLDVLVNNAGRGWMAPLGDFPERGWDKVMDLNVKSPFFLTQELIPLLTRRATPEQTSSIINIGSIAGLTANPVDTYSYDVSKAGIHMVTRNLAFTLSQQNVRVNAIAPGRFHSDMTEFAKADPASYDAELRMIPMHRWGDADDIKGVALMLASQAGAFITGQIIPVDGGVTLVA